MTSNPNKLSRFWQELKRRKVLRSLAIYAGTAFIILEASTIIFPRWDLPDWSIDLVLWLLILGAVYACNSDWSVPPVMKSSCGWANTERKKARY